MARAVLLAGLVLMLARVIPGDAAWAQPAGEAPDAAPADPSTPRLSDEDIQELVAPIALYPDTLLANVLAASVYAEDVKAASAHVAAGKSLDDPAAQEWDPSVVTVAGVPDALKMLTDYPEWSDALGQAFVTQGQDVMTAVQALRARAWANGALQNSPQQTVVTTDQTIVIEPAEPTVIYVPRYDPQIVYVEKPDTGGRLVSAVIGFGVGVAVGALFADLDCDWRLRHVHWGWRRPHHHWHSNSNTNINININRPTVNIRPGDSWRPRPNRPGLSPSGRPGRPTLGQLRGIGSGIKPPIRLPGRPVGSRPIASPNRPSVMAKRPGMNPTARPSAPVARPNLTRPGGAPGAARPTPGAFPRPPSTMKRPPEGSPTRPTAKPASRPSPAARPAPAPRPAAAPSSRPAPRPSGLKPGSGNSRPTARPAPRPASRPAARPSRKR